MKTVHLRCLLVLIGAFLFASIGARGQGKSSLRGSVTDHSGGAVSGATVVLSNNETSFTRETSSVADGVYQFLDVPPGIYAVTVSASGFKSSKFTNIQLLVNTPTTLDAVLDIGAATETIMVSSEAGSLNTEDATVGNAFQQSQVQQLPIESRNVVDLLSLQPGVVYLGNRTDIDYNQDTRSGSVNGGRSDQTTVSMDGIDVTDQAKGLAFTSILRTTPDSLQEFRVTTSNPTATEGNSSSAQVALVTKSGTNSFHGAFYEYLRNTATSANDYFIKESQLASGQPNKAPELNRNVFGVAIGGPILKNRLFFFANYEGRRDTEQVSEVATIPTASLRQGEVLYPNTSGTITTVTPQNFQQWDPLGIGVNSTLLKYFQSFPMPNDNSVGDGLNFSGYRFAAPTSGSYNVWIGRVDWKIDAKGSHQLFWRGSVQNDSVTGPAYLPGYPPQSKSEDRGKGFAVGYTALIKQTLVNEFRFGLTRASLGNVGDSNTPFLGLNVITGGITRSNSTIIPTWNLSDVVSWTKGRHSFQFGTAMQFITDSVTSNNISFNQANLSTTFINTGGFATTGNAFDPDAEGFPNVSPNFTLGYDQAAFDVLGIITNVSANYNYNRNGALLPEGEPIKRHYALNQYDFFFQDSFRLTPTMTINLGLRYQLESPPYETKGLQVSSTFPLGSWLQQREANMVQGIPSNQDPTLEYVLGGKANNGPPFYHWDYKNLAPRVSVAWAPRPSNPGLLKAIFGEGRTSIRAGFAMTYDHFGTELINTFAQNGSFGLATNLVTPLGSQSVDCAPRVTGLTDVPVYGCPNQNNGYITIPAPPGGFPQIPPIGVANGGFGNGFSLDEGIKTPYVYMLDFSVAREITPTTIVEAAYIGRLSHRLLSQEDFAPPLDIVDPKSGIDYFSAIDRLSTLARQGVTVDQITPSIVGPTAPYWSNLFSPITGSNVPNTQCAAGTCTPLQAIYSMERLYIYNETFIPYFLDIPGFICPNGCSTLGPYTYYNPQFFSLYGWRSMGTGNYHALQVSFRKRYSHGILFDLNYTFSKSMDLTSSASRVAPINVAADLANRVGPGIINSFNPRQMYAVSDYDMTHQFNANWVVELPFGRGQKFAAEIPGWLNAVIGGWQFSGLYRITSGLPFSISNGVNLPTNGSNAGLATQVGAIRTGRATKAPTGQVYMFPDTNAAFNAYEFTFPGQSGTRNQVRGDGFLGFDASLSKRWVMPYNDGHSIQFRWEVFNVGNSTRFDVNSNPPSLTNSTNFGTYNGLLTNPRVMQFALRYEF